MIKERLEALRKEMEKRKITVYVVPTSDFHESEYVGEHFKARKFITGFTGSAGTAVITPKEAGLWTDGRYFLQAEEQLKGTTVTLFKMGEEGVPTVMEYVKDNLSTGEKLGFDGRVINTRLGKQFQEVAEEKKAELYTSEDLIDLIWSDRPALPTEPVWILEKEYSGETLESKLTRVRKEMEKEGCQVHLLSCLYDIAWLLNIRGGDIASVPVVLSFVAVTKKDCFFFVHEETLDEKVRAYLNENKVTVKPYEAIYSYAEALENTTVLLDDTSVNSNITGKLKDSVKVVAEPNPTYLMKAIKNETELKNTREAHLKDAVAVTKFMYWLKNNIGKETITEISASDHLESLRRQQEHFVDLSFGTISAYGANAALMHYSATEESNATLEPRSFLLVDSGGHYLEGTTDITRTFALGELTEEEICNFTAVCRSNLKLAAAKFLYGCSGLNLDILARGPLWDMGLDYKCGTGHGVGHILNVHEGPNGFRWRVVPERNDNGTLEEGMITTDEPGVYVAGKYGIRTENEMICRKAEKNEYGQFMEFETITFVPIDLDAIDPEQMDASERKLLNHYHSKVYEKVSPYLTEEERAWLKEYTRAI